METNGRRILFLGIALVTISLCGAGCAKKSVMAEGYPVRFQDVGIPGYHPRDYMDLLGSDHEPSRCNAICNLIPQAREYGELLSPSPAGAPDKPRSTDEASLQTARGVYAGIKRNIGGTSKACQLAALIFLDEFAATYKRHQEVVDLVLSIQTRDARIQYEQLNVLQTVSSSPHLIDSGELKPFLDSPAWMVRAKTYVLLSRLPSAELEARLVQDYDKSKLESEKILILHAIGNGYGPDGFALLQREIQASPSPKLKMGWAGRVSAYRNQEAARRWLLGGDALLDDPTLKAVVADYCGTLEVPDTQRFFEEMIRSGQARWLQALDPECFFKGLSEAFSADQKSEALADLEAAVLNSEPLGEQWREHQARLNLEANERAAREKMEEHFAKSVLPKYNRLLESFLKDTEKLFRSEGIDQKETDAMTKDLRQMLDLLQKEESQ
jgi:hypothetical protein